MAKLPTVEHSHDLAEFLAKIIALCADSDVTGIAIVLSRQNGEALSSHQFGMDDSELAISSALLDDYAKGFVGDNIAH